MELEARPGGADVLHRLIRLFAVERGDTLSKRRATVVAEVTVPAHLSTWHIEAPNGFYNAARTKSASMAEAVECAYNKPSAFLSLLYLWRYSEKV